MDIPSSATVLQLLMLFIGMPLVIAALWLASTIFRYERWLAKEIKKWSEK